MRQEVNSDSQKNTADEKPTTHEDLKEQIEKLSQKIEKLSQSETKIAVLSYKIQVALSGALAFFACFISTFICGLTMHSTDPNTSCSMLIAAQVSLIFMVICLITSKYYEQQFEKESNPK
jgi:hypothetical protein